MPLRGFQNHHLARLKEHNLIAGIYSQKSAKRKRHLRDDAVISKADKALVRRMLPY